MRWMMATAGLALMAGSSAAADPLPEFQQGREGSILGTPAQIDADRRALAVYNSREVQKAINDLAALYEKDPVAQYPDARKTLRRAAEAMAMAQSFGVVAADPDRAQALWGTTGPHAWGDLVIPVEGVMVDNPDNIYRSIPIDGAASYIIEGRVVHAAYFTCS